MKRGSFLVTLAAVGLFAAAARLAGPVRAQAPAGAPPSPQPQEPAITFPAQIEQVTVDVVVADKKGNPITGLTKGDLVVLEDGVPQSIVSFEPVQVPALPSEKPAPRPKIATNTVKEDQRGRTFVVVFDDIHLTPAMAQRAKGAVAEFLKTGTREGDQVTLLSTGGSVWWSTRLEAGREALVELTKRLDGRYIPDLSPERMTDYEAMRIHVHHDPIVRDRVLRRFEQYGVAGVMRGQTERRDIAGFEDPFVSTRATEVYFAATSRNRITLEVLERSLNALVSVKGRKSLILVSEGFIHDPNLEEFRRVNEASRRANTAIYFVNSRGLEGMPVAMTAQFGPALPDQDVGAAFSEPFEAAAGADAVAGDSGGFSVRNTNDLSGGFRRIADETRAYYLVGYNPTNLTRDGKFRKIQVKVPGQKGVQVRARKGYYAPSDKKVARAVKPGTDPVLQEALDSPYEMDQIPLRMTHYVGAETLLDKANTLVVTEVDVRSLSFEEKDGRSTDTVQFLLVVAHRESGEYFRYDQSVELKLLPATRDRLGRTWMPLVREFELRPGGYQAKIVVRDKNSQKVGTVIHEFDVPDTVSFRVSTPIISDVRDTNEETGPGGRLSLLARRTFAPAGSLFCQFEVFGARKDEKSGMPKVAMGYEVRRADGSIFVGARPTVINPTSLGKLSRMVGFSLENASPGEYEMVMSFKDELSGDTVELREPFTVSADQVAEAPVSSGG
jgi:VWFA-related protein